MFGWLKLPVREVPASYRAEVAEAVSSGRFFRFLIGNEEVVEAYGFEWHDFWTALARLEEAAMARRER